MDTSLTPRRPDGKPRRSMEYDFIRMMAMVYVISAHAMGQFPEGTPQWTEFCNLIRLFFTGSGLFFLMSGKFALTRTYDTPAEVGKYYYKKVVTLIVPMLFYMLLRMAYDVGWEIFTPDFWKTYIRGVLGGSENSPEYWFLYILLGNTLLVPIMAQFFAKAQTWQLWLFATLGYVYNGICAYAPAINATCSWYYMFAGWTFVFYLGACLEKLIDTRKKEYILYALGALSILISMYQKHVGYTEMIHDASPTFTLIVCSMFFLLKRVYHGRSALLNRAIRFIGKHSFAVYMVHMRVLWLVVEYVPFTEHFLPYMLLYILLTTVFSLLIGTILDLTIVALLKKLTARIIKLFWKNAPETA